MSAGAGRRLLAIEQRPIASAAAWVVEGGHPVSGREDERRLGELKRGLMHHPDVRIEPAVASDYTVESTLRTLHEPDYLDALGAITSEEPVVIPELAAPDRTPDVPICASLVTTAWEGARTAITAAERIAAGARYVYALSRPPGHHAGPSWFGGYCYLNNAAAAALTLVNRGFGEVGILDVDLHYPNGTAALVGPVPQIKLYSLHSQARPGMPASRGAPPHGELRTEFSQAPDAASYLRAIADAMDALERSAAVIVLSLGYDTVRDDPHGCWTFSPAIFARIGRLVGAAGLPVCVVQEGGYSLGRLAACSYAFARGLLDSRPPGRSVGGRWHSRSHRRGARPPAAKRPPRA